MYDLKNSQIAIEFMIFFGMSVIFAIIFLVISLDQTRDLNKIKETETLKEIALKIQSEIGITSYVEDGYSREFKIPEKVNNKDYNISIRSNTLSVWTETAAYVILVLNVTGNLTKGSNSIKVIDGATQLN